MCLSRSLSYRSSMYILFECVYTLVHISDICQFCWSSEQNCSYKANPKKMPPPFPVRDVLIRMAMQQLRLSLDVPTAMASRSRQGAIALARAAAARAATFLFFAAWRIEAAPTARSSFIHAPPLCVAHPCMQSRGGHPGIQVAVQRSTLAGGADGDGKELEEQP